MKDLHNRWALAAVALTLVFSATSVRAQNPPTGPTYVVDKDASRVYIKVDRTNRLGHLHGVEGMVSAGSMTIGGAGKLVFDMTTFTADTANARRYVGIDGEVSAADARKVNDNMRGGDCLDVAKFPSAQFTMTTIHPADGQAVGAAGRYLIDGQFTLHGVTRQLQILTELSGTQTPGTASLKGWFTISQKDFGMKPFSVAGGAVAVEDKLTIYGNLVLRLTP